MKKYLAEEFFLQKLKYLEEAVIQLVRLFPKKLSYEIEKKILVLEATIFISNIFSVLYFQNNLLHT